MVPLMLLWIFTHIISYIVTQYFFWCFQCAKHKKQSEFKALKSFNRRIVTTSSVELHLDSNSVWRRNEESVLILVKSPHEFANHHFIIIIINICGKHHHVHDNSHPYLPSYWFARGVLVDAAPGLSWNHATGDRQGPSGWHLSKNVVVFAGLGGIVCEKLTMVWMVFNPLWSPPNPKPWDRQIVWCSK